ncbi:hypothetical protein VNO77_11500 [Canavalia gladiata]|uniref:Uncharacterized protein n=1 Tax=Canavalia gladiata TaxID=3824 RepID=A0AAN9R2P3_CANGL
MVFALLFELLDTFSLVQRLFAKKLRWQTIFWISNVYVHSLRENRGVSTMVLLWLRKLQLNKLIVEMESRRIAVRLVHGYFDSDRHCYTLVNKSESSAEYYMSNGCPPSLLPLLSSDHRFKDSITSPTTHKIQHQTEAIISLEMQKMIV